MRLPRTRTVGLLYVCITLVLVGSLMRTVRAPAPPSAPSIPTTSYGLITIFNSNTFNGGTITVRISTDSSGPFFVEKVLILLNVPSSVDVVLTSISVDGAYVFTFNNYQQPTQVIVVSSGSTIGDIITSIPTYLSDLLTKDPMSNVAMFASGATNGLAFGLTMQNGFSGITFSALALVCSPSTATVTLSFS